MSYRHHKWKASIAGYEHDRESKPDDNYRMTATHVSGLLDQNLMVTGSTPTDHTEGPGHTLTASQRGWAGVSPMEDAQIPTSSAIQTCAPKPQVRCHNATMPGSNTFRKHPHQTPFSFLPAPWGPLSHQELKRLTHGPSASLLPHIRSPGGPAQRGCSAPLLDTMWAGTLASGVPNRNSVSPWELRLPPSPVTPPARLVSGKNRSW